MYFCFLKREKYHRFWEYAYLFVYEKHKFVKNHRNFFPM